MADTYLTVAAPAEGWYKEKMSKFLSFIHPVGSAAEAKEVIASYQKKYHDARHVCWAYMLGAGRADFLSSDNGEPSGTAGKPILGAINSAGLTNVVIVVVRYFGGIKLGTGGLIVAYREAAREAIAAATVVERHEEALLTFNFPYLAMNSVMRVVKDPGISLVSQSFDNSCSITLSVRSDHASRLSERLLDIDGVTAAD